MNPIAAFLRALWRYLLPEWAGRRLLAAMTRKLKRELLGQATDKLVELLLGAMKLGCILVPNYRTRLRNYEATLTFRCATGNVAASAIIHDEALHIDRNPTGAGDCLITFTTPRALVRFLFARDHDILESMLKNEVTVEGNVSQIYRFGFLANELLFLLDIAPE